MNKKEIRKNKQTCSKCFQWKDLANFNKSSKSPSGHRYQCRDCEKFYKIAHRYNTTIKIAHELWKVEKCEICDTKFSEYGSGHHKHRCIDHDHETGKIRGVLCNACNGALGYFKDNIKNLERAKEYLLSNLQKELEKKGLAELSQYNARNTR